MTVFDYLKINSDAMRFANCDFKSSLNTVLRVLFTHHLFMFHKKKC
jgi:hypothetical protein